MPLLGYLLRPYARDRRYLNLPPLFRVANEAFGTDSCGGDCAGPGNVPNSEGDGCAPVRTIPCLKTHGCRSVDCAATFSCIFIVRADRPGLIS